MSDLALSPHAIALADAIRRLHMLEAYTSQACNEIRELRVKRDSDIAADIADGNCSLRSIAAKHGVSEGTVRNIKKRMYVGADDYRGK